MCNCHTDVVGKPEWKKIERERKKRVSRESMIQVVQFLGCPSGERTQAPQANDLAS